MKVIAYFAIGIVLAVVLFFRGRKELDLNKDAEGVAAVLCAMIFIWPLVVLSMLVAYMYIWLGGVENEEETGEEGK